MKTNIYVLEKDDIQMFMDSVPEYVCENVSKEGYYTLASTTDDNAAARKIIGGFVSVIYFLVY